MSLTKSPQDKTGHALDHAARKELVRMLYHPNFSSNPDDSLRLVNEVLRPSRPLSHADVDDITDEQVGQLLERLRPILRDRRDVVIARIKRMLCDPI